MLGHKSDIADGSLRAWEFRQFGNLVGDYCISPRFLDAVSVGPYCTPHNIFSLALGCIFKIFNFDWYLENSQ